MRPGEKLYEELLIGESVTGTEHPKIMRAEEDFLVWEELQDLLNRLQLACREMNLAEIREILLEAVDGFEPKEEISDPLWDIQSKEYATGADNSGAASMEGESATVTHLFRE